MPIENALPNVVENFLQAVNEQDAAAAAECFTADAQYYFAMPHAPVRGRDAVRSTLERVLTEADRVRWDVVASATAGDRVFFERIDRFWFGEAQAAIECVGVVELSDGLIKEIRDYAELGAWRQRKAAAQGED